MLNRGCTYQDWTADFMDALDLIDDGLILGLFRTKDLILKVNALEENRFPSIRIQVANRFAAFNLLLLGDQAH